MSLDINYLAVVFNSTIRMMTPVLFVALASAICNRVKVFNIALEGLMLTGAFFAVVVSHFTGSPWLGVLGAVVSSTLVAFVVGFFMVKLKAAPLVVGVSTNMLMSGMTTFLMMVIFGSKGSFTDPSLQGLPKVPVPFGDKIPLLGTLLGSLTPLDLFSFVMAVLIFIFMFKTVAGFHMRSVGINKEATESLGTRAERIQLLTVLFSGVLCGLGGSLLTLGQVTMYAQNITAGRGFFAMAASNLGGAHPLGVIVSSFFFGFAEALGNMLQGTAIRSQLTMSIPYIATIIGLVVFNLKDLKKRKKQLI